MASKFSMAGSAIVAKKQRARTVRPYEDEAQKCLQPIAEDVPGDLEDETEKKENRDEWEDGDRDQRQHARRTKNSIHSDLCSNEIKEKLFIETFQ